MNDIYNVLTRIFAFHEECVDREYVEQNQCHDDIPEHILVQIIIGWKYSYLVTRTVSSNLAYKANSLGNFPSCRFVYYLILSRSAGRCRLVVICLINSSILIVLENIE